MRTMRMNSFIFETICCKTPPKRGQNAMANRRDICAS
jgi:hypothetical protein